MHHRHAVPPALTLLADQQDGVVSREQALALGVGRAVLQRLCDQGAWTRLGRGVFWTRSGPPPWRATAWAGVLLGGDQARLGPEASGHLWQLVAEPEVVDVLVPYGRGCSADGPWTFVRERPGVRTPRSVGQPPRLPAADTVLDLAARREDGEVVDLVTRAVAQRVTSVPGLRRALDDRSRHPARKLLLSLLADVDEGVESGLELRYLRDVERPHGLPRGTRNRYRNGLRYRSDVGYDDFGLLVELDGRLGHDGVGRFRDFRRDNAFAVRELITLRYGWHDVVEWPCAVAGQVATVLQGRGWDGVPTRCPRCWRLV